MLLPQKRTVQALPAGLEQLVLAPVPLVGAAEDGIDHMRVAFIEGSAL
jgi:hypothetical protein